MRWLSLLLMISVANAFIANGNITLSTIDGYDKCGFLFNKGIITGINGDIYYYDGYLWTNGPNGLLSVNDNNYCPTDGYDKRVKPIINSYYCVKCNDNSYAIIRITSLSNNSISFEWKHQRDNTNYFINNNKSGWGINWLLIIIILLLLIILFRRRK